MRRYFLITIVLTMIGLVFLSCSNDDDVDSVDNPYRDGEISFRYSSNDKTVIDSTLVFTSRWNFESQLEDYGYYDPSIGWGIIIRLNPENFSNRTSIFFSGTNLDTLSFPYTFQAQQGSGNAQINYTVDSEIITDESTGRQVSVSNTYFATTSARSFNLTIFSKRDNRLEGEFYGELKNRNGDTITVENGKFDVEILAR
jgi:hypothetical protein